MALEIKYGDNGNKIRDVEAPVLSDLFFNVAKNERANTIDRLNQNQDLRAWLDEERKMYEHNRTKQFNTDVESKYGSTPELLSFDTKLNSARADYNNTLERTRGAKIQNDNALFNNERERQMFFDLGNLYHMNPDAVNHLSQVFSGSTNQNALYDFLAKGLGTNNADLIKNISIYPRDKDGNPVMANLQASVSSNGMGNSESSDFPTHTKFNNGTIVPNEVIDETARRMNIPSTSLKEFANGLVSETPPNTLNEFVYKSNSFKQLPNDFGINDKINMNASRFGLDPYMMKAIANSESGGNSKAKNPFSTAYGVFQFIDSTWKGLTPEFAKEFGRTPNRDNVDDQISMGALYMSKIQNMFKNDKGLKSVGYVPQLSDVYLGLFLGEYGGLNLRKASLDPNNWNKSLNSYLSNGAIDNNKGFTKNKDGSTKTLGEFIRDFDRSFYIKYAKAGGGEVANPNIASATTPYYDSVINAVAKDMKIGRTPNYTPTNDRVIDDLGEVINTGYKETPNRMYSMPYENSTPAIYKDEVPSTLSLPNNRSQDSFNNPEIANKLSYMDNPNYMSEEELMAMVNTPTNSDYIRNTIDKTGGYSLSPTTPFDGEGYAYFLSPQNPDEVVRIPKGELENPKVKSMINNGHITQLTRNLSGVTPKHTQTDHIYNIREQKSIKEFDPKTGELKTVDVNPNGMNSSYGMTKETRETANSLQKVANSYRDLDSRMKEVNSGESLSKYKEDESKMYNEAFNSLTGGDKDIAKELGKAITNNDRSRSAFIAYALNLKGRYKSVESNENTQEIFRNYIIENKFKNRWGFQRKLDEVKNTLGDKYNDTIDLLDLFTNSSREILGNVNRVAKDDSIYELKVGDKSVGSVPVIMPNTYANVLDKAYSIKRNDWESDGKYSLVGKDFDLNNKDSKDSALLGKLADYGSLIFDTRDIGEPNADNPRREYYDYFKNNKELLQDVRIQRLADYFLSDKYNPADTELLPALEQMIDSTRRNQYNYKYQQNSIYKALKVLKQQGLLDKDKK